MVNLNSKIVSGVVLVFLSTWGSLNLSAQQSAKDLFVSMPDTVCPLLTAVNRADFVDFLESNMRAKVENRLNESVEMTDLSNDYIKINSSAQSSWQMKLLPINDSTQVICTVSTVCAPVCDSDVRFYSKDWKPLPANAFITPPDMNSFMLRPDSSLSVKYDEAILSIDMLLMKVDLAKDNNNLTYIFTTPEYLEKEMAEKFNPFIRRSIIFDWKEGRYLPLTTTVDE